MSSGWRIGSGSESQLSLDAADCSPLAIWASVERWRCRGLGLHGYVRRMGLSVAAGRGMPLRKGVVPGLGIRGGDCYSRMYGRCMGSICCRPVSVYSTP
jgi:hypothetical protein